MPMYEIRILKNDRYSASLIVEQHHISDHGAVRTASKLAGGHWFEVWRALDCIYGLPSGRTSAASASSDSRNL
jgi:hypothetical protein